MLRHPLRPSKKVPILAKKQTLEQLLKKQTLEHSCDQNFHDVAGHRRFDGSTLSEQIDVHVKRVPAIRVDPAIARRTKNNEHTDSTEKALCKFSIAQKKSRMTSPVRGFP